MGGARGAAKQGLQLGISAIGHATWWLRWHSAHRACREVPQLGPPPPRTAEAERRAA